MNLRKKREDNTAWLKYLSDRKKKTKKPKKKKYEPVKLRNDYDLVYNEVHNKPKKKKSTYKPIKTSKGEAAVASYLLSNKIKFKREYTPRGLKNPLTDQRLRFDFYIPNLRLFIEYDGKQHFQEVKKFDSKNDNLEKRKFRDHVKNVYCDEQGYKLLRIKYNENTTEKLDNYFNPPNLLQPFLP